MLRKVFYNGEEQFAINTNRSLTITEALYAHGIDVNSQEDLAEAYNNKVPYILFEDNYFVDFNNLSME